MAKKKDKNTNPGRVIIPTNHPSPPEQHEIDAAYALARHFQTLVEFIVPVDDYKRKSGDVVMHGVVWVIKCPVGDSKSTISNQIRRASKQSMNIIIDTRRTKLRFNEIEKRVQLGVSGKSSVKRLILINKVGKVLEIKK